MEIYVELLALCPAEQHVTLQIQIDTVRYQVLELELCTQMNRTITLEIVNRAGEHIATVTKPAGENVRQCVNADYIYEVEAVSETESESE